MHAGDVMKYMPIRLRYMMAATRNVMLGCMANDVICDVVYDTVSHCRTCQQESSNDSLQVRGVMQQTTTTHSEPRRWKLSGAGCK